MNNKGSERRKHKRYNTEAEIYFDFIYDLQTKVEFELIDQKDEKALSKKYSAVSRNVSVGGIAFRSSHKVKQEDLLHMEVYLPGTEEPINMKGKVEWCKPVRPSYEDRLLEDVEGRRVFEVGVRLLLVNDQSVEESIHHDQIYDVDWSIVLEHVFGNYRLLMEGKHKPKE